MHTPIKPVNWHQEVSGTVLNNSVTSYIYLHIPSTHNTLLSPLVVSREGEACSNVDDMYI